MDYDNILKGVKLSLENSNSLRSIAKLSGIQNEFGIASSLNILAAEEAIKALILFKKLFGVDSEDFDKFFKDHKIKHKSIRESLKWLVYTNKSYELIYKNIIDGLKRGKKFTQDEISEQHKKGISELKSWVETIKSGNNPFLKELEWWQFANIRKNEGFYVDFRNGKWKSPKSISKEKYEKEEVYVDKIINEINKINIFINYDTYEEFRNQNFMDEIIEKIKNDD